MASNQTNMDLDSPTTAAIDINSSTQKVIGVASETSQSFVVLSPSYAQYCTGEAEYDTEPTTLYSFIEKRDWKNVMIQCKNSPKEASILIYRREDGKVKWSHLPLHAAVIFRASSNVIKSLLEANPYAGRVPDDLGMLPCHIAFRCGASESVINLLLDFYPESISVKDNKGRLPIMLVKPFQNKNNNPQSIDTSMTSNVRNKVNLRSYVAQYITDMKTEFELGSQTTGAKMENEQHEKEIEKLKNDHEMQMINREEILRTQVENEYNKRLKLVEDKFESDLKEGSNKYEEASVKVGEIMAEIINLRIANDEKQVKMTELENEVEDVSKQLADKTLSQETLESRNESLLLEFKQHMEREQSRHERGLLECKQQLEREQSRHATEQEGYLEKIKVLEAEKIVLIEQHVADLETKDAGIATYSKKMASCKEEISSLEAQNRRMLNEHKAEIKSKRTEISSLHTDLDRKSKETKELHESLAPLNDQITEKNNSIGNYREEIRELTDRNSSLITALNAKDKVIGQHKDNMEAGKSLHEALSKRIKIMEKSKQNLEEQVTVLKEKLDTEVDEKRSAVEESKAKIQELETMHKEANLKHNIDLEDKTTEVNELTSRLEETTKEHVSLQEYVERLEAEVDAEQGEKENLQTKVEDLSAQITQASSKEEESLAVLHGYEEALRNKEEALEKLKKKLVAAETEKEEHRGNLILAGDQLKELDHNNTLYETTLQDLTDRVKSLEASNKDYELAVQELGEKLAEEQDLNDDYKEGIKDLHGVNKEFEKKVYDLKESLRVSSLENAALVQANQEEKERFGVLREKINEIKMDTTDIMDSGRSSNRRLGSQDKENMRNESINMSSGRRRV